MLQIPNYKYTLRILVIIYSKEKNIVLTNCVYIHIFV